MIGDAKITQLLQLNTMDAVATPKTLCITKKLLSFRDKFDIADETGAVLYECTSRWSWFNPSWILTCDGKEVAVFKRKLWRIVSTWDVKTDADGFTLRGKLWTMRRHIAVHGGLFDGAVLTGSLFDQRFEIVRHGRILAKARGRFLTLRARHDIELLDVSPEAVLFTAILMANLMVQKHDEDDVHGEHSVHSH